MARVPSKWRWHFRVLLALQERLLREQADTLNSVTEPLEPHSLSEADSATDEFDHDLALARLSAEQDAIYEVTEALGRILDGTYGICQQTGEGIPAARLRAIPWARLTRQAETLAEREGHASTMRVESAGTVRGRGRIWLAQEEELEETGEKPTAPPKDEAMTHVYSPPATGPVRRRRTKNPRAHRVKSKRRRTE